jgi:hypothetical protein
MDIARSVPDYKRGTNSGRSRLTEIPAQGWYRWSYMALHNRALHNLLRCAIPGLLLLAGVAATTDADAQRRRMPVRTEEVPDTESGRPAASAERPSFKGRMIIFGPQELPIGAPPEHSRKPDPEPVAVPKPAPAPPTQIAVPAPAPTPPPAQAAIPAPTPAPPAPAAVPLPAQAAVPAPAPAPPPARIAAPAPTPPPPAPLVVVPAPTPPPASVVVVPAPSPPSAPVAAPIRAAPVVAPIAAPAPARPAAPVAPPRQEIALAAPSSAAASPAAPMAIEAKLIESIFNCLSPGLPPDWKRAWVEIIDQGGGREKQAKFRVSNIGHASDEGEPLEPCNARALTGSIVSLNEKLPPDRRAWSRALLVIESDGEYELTYDYPK